MTFKEWFYNAPHREKYTTDHPAYLAAQEAWEAAHEACAKVLDEMAAQDKWTNFYGVAANAIRARNKS